MSSSPECDIPNFGSLSEFLTFANGPIESDHADLHDPQQPGQVPVRRTSISSQASPPFPELESLPEVPTFADDSQESGHGGLPDHAQGDLGQVPEALQSPRSPHGDREVGSSLGGGFEVGT